MMDAKFTERDTNAMMALAWAQGLAAGVQAATEQHAANLNATRGLPHVQILIPPNPYKDWRK